MKAHFLRAGPGILILSAFCWLLSRPAGASQLVSRGDALTAGGVRGNGDSGLSIMSADGRYVLFSSAANNLVLTASNNPIPMAIPARMNVYCRDCANGLTALVSVNTAGNGGNGDSFAMGISSNGQYALFESGASDLVPGDTNNADDIFVRDCSRGTTVLVSVSTNGGAGNGISRTPVMTPDGRYVAFVSSANNLVAADTNGIPDIFVRDLQLGVTTLASPGARSAGATAGSGSAAPALTPDGRYAVFFSTATNLVSGNTNVGDIYVRDLVAGSTTWVSSGARSLLQPVLGVSNGVCFSPKISADGSLVAYEVSPANYGKITGVVLRFHMPAGPTDVVNTNASAPVGSYEDLRTLDTSADGRFVVSLANTDATGANTAVDYWDALAGTHVLLSPSWSNGVPAGGTCSAPVMDASGRYAAFLSNSGNLVTNALSGVFHLYSCDAQTGTLTLVDADTNGVGVGVGPETFPCWSATAEYLTFESAGWSDRNRYYDVWRWDRGANANALVSAPDPAFAFPSADGASALFANSVSATARYLAFASDADNLAPGVTNGYRNVFVRDLLLGTNVLVSVNTNGGAAAGNSSQPALSGDGRFAVFVSNASDLVSADNNSACDVFVRDLQNGVTTLVSVNASGSGSANSNSFLPTISADGRRVLFYSQANNLVAGSFGSGITNLFLRDLTAGVTYALTKASSGNGVFSAAMTPDGHYVAFIGAAMGTSPGYLYVWDSTLARLIYTNTTSPLAQVSISSNGQRLAYLTSASGSLSVVDLLAATNNAVVCSGKFPARSGLGFSGDGHFVVFATSAALSSQATNGTWDVYRYDLLAKTNQLISGNDLGHGDGNDASDSPVISPDGRLVVYRSSASNLTPGDSNGVPDVFLFDEKSGATMLLTASQWGGVSGANRSLNPCFSADGQTLVFQSAAFDLVTNDFNPSGDIFVFNLFAAGLIPFFYVQAIPGNPLHSAPTLAWPVLSGKTYQVLFKNNLSDPAWQAASGNITITGNSASFTDTDASSGTRFYFIVGR